LKESVALHKDPLLLAALLAGPVFWILLYLSERPDILWDKPLHYPVWFLKLVLVYPVIEEIIFRGLLQELLRDYISKASIGPLTVANLLTSVLFAAAHLFYHVPLWAASVFFPSLVFGFFKERTGALTAPFLLHAYYNAGYIWLFSVPG
jgi:CAAX protease family protein